MKKIALKVNYGAVLEEVAKTTAYAAAKMDGDATATSRVSTVDEDEEMLRRYWYEAKDTLLASLSRFLVAEEEEEDGTLVLTLETGSAFNMALLDSMNSALFSYFVQSIMSQWFVLANKGEAGAYASGVAARLEDIVKKLLSRTRPQRPKWPPLAPSRRGGGRRRHGRREDWDETDSDTDDEDEDEEENSGGTEDTEGTDGSGSSGTAGNVYEDFDDGTDADGNGSPGDAEDDLED